VVVPSNGLRKTNDGNCNFLPKFDDNRAPNKEGLSKTRDQGQIGVAKLGKHLNQNRIEEQANM